MPQISIFIVKKPHAMRVVQKAYSYTKTSHDTITEVMLSIVFRKFIPKLNRLDCYVPGWAMPVKDARTTPVLDGQWADW